MRVPQDILECVGFLSRKKKNEGYKIYGTAFFVSVPSETASGVKFHYLVTAKHLVDETHEAHGELFLRVNTDDRAEYVRVKGTWSFVNNDKKVDIDAAAIRFIPEPHFVYRTIPIEAFIGHREFAVPANRSSVGIGDEVMVSGLFKGHHGKKRNIPIVRFGTIAAMPGELLDSTSTDKPHQSYIIESRSLGGLSGSPVFLILDPPSGMTCRERPHDYAVLGLIRSYWFYDIETATLTPSKHEKVEVNAGISAVTPSERILQIIYGEELIAARREEDETRSA